MIELLCEYLSVRSIWLYILIISRTRFRVNPHPIVAWMPKNSLLEINAISEVYFLFRARSCLRFSNYRAWIHSETRTAVGRGLNLTPACGFSKNVSSKERVKPWFFVTFNIIFRHIFPGNFIEFLQVVLNIWRNSL